VVRFFGEVDPQNPDGAGPRPLAGTKVEGYLDDKRTSGTR
jgi:hypothetical protein